MFIIQFVYLIRILYKSQEWTEQSYNSMNISMCIKLLNIKQQRNLLLTDTIYDISFQQILLLCSDGKQLGMQARSEYHRPIYPRQFWTHFGHGCLQWPGRLQGQMTGVLHSDCLCCRILSYSDLGVTHLSTLRHHEGTYIKFALCTTPQS